MTYALKSRPKQAPVTSWRNVLPTHAAAKLLPPISQDDLRELGEGQRCVGDSVALARADRRCVMSGRRSRDKGNRVERALVHALQEAGFAAERVPLSGAARGRFGGDLSIPILGIDRRCEVKARANGFRKLYAWLEGADFLIVRADRSEPLIVLLLKLAVEIATAAERGKAVMP